MTRYLLDISGRSIVVLCRECGWRDLQLDREQAKRAAESHLIRVHCTPEQACDIRENQRRRGRRPAP